MGRELTEKEFELVSNIHENMNLEKVFDKAKKKIIAENPKLKKQIENIRFVHWEHFLLETADCTRDLEEDG